MAQSANIVWEVRTGGAATNGGGYKVGAGTTDYSQQTSPQLSVTDAACTGNTTVTSVTGGFTSAMVGNVMYLSSGPGWYEITGYTDTNTVTIDRNGPNASGMTAKVGGCLNSLNTLASAMGTIGQWAWVKADGTYTQTASPTFLLNGSPSNSVMFTRICGYTTTRGDGGRASIVLSGSSLNGIYFYNTGSGYMIENFDIDCANQTSSYGISDGGGSSIYNVVRNVKVSNFKGGGIRASSSYTTVIDCEVTGGGTAATAGVYITGGQGNHVNRNWIHDNSCPGISCAGTCDVSFNLVTNNAGSTSDGIVTSYGCNILNNTIHSNGRHGININTTFNIAVTIRNNLITDHTVASTSAIKFNSTGAIAATPLIDGNAFYNNTANRTNGDKSDGIMALTPGPYTNVLDVVVTDGSPYVNAAGNDFRLNGHPLRGGKLRGAATPGILPGLASVLGAIDFGCYQTNSTGSRARS